MYKREFELFKDGDMWLAMPLGMLGGTEGHNHEEAIEMACDWLRMMAEHAEIRGIELSEQKPGLPLEHGGERLIVCVQTGRELIDTVSASEAANMLGISRARVSVLVKNLKLEGWHDGRNVRVTRESVLARLRGPKAVGGRPKKAAYAAAH